MDRRTDLAGTTRRGLTTATPRPPRLPPPAARTATRRGHSTPAGTATAPVEMGEEEETATAELETPTRQTAGEEREEEAVMVVPTTAPGARPRPVSPGEGEGVMAQAPGGVALGGSAFPPAEVGAAATAREAAGTTRAVPRLLPVVGAPTQAPPGTALPLLLEAGFPRTIPLAVAVEGAWRAAEEGLMEEVRPRPMALVPRVPTVLAQTHTSMEARRVSRRWGSPQAIGTAQEEGEEDREVATDHLPVAPASL